MRCISLQLTMYKLYQTDWNPFMMVSWIECIMNRVQFTLATLDALKIFIATSYLYYLLVYVISSVFTLCKVCYLRAEPRSGEWIRCFNSPVPVARNALRLMGAQLRLCLTAYAPRCAHVWAQDRGLEAIPANEETVQRANTRLLLEMTVLSLTL